MELDWEPHNVSWACTDRLQADRYIPRTLSGGGGGLKTDIYDKTAKISKLVCVFICPLSLAPFLKILILTVLISLNYSSNENNP